MPAVLADAGTSSPAVLAVVAVGAVLLAVPRAPANDGLFPHAFTWADRHDNAWFGIVIGALLPSLLMSWRYTSSTGLTVFTYLVDLTVVTVALPYLFSALAQLAYLVSRQRRVQGTRLARGLPIAGAAALFSLWVTCSSGYQPYTRP
jgi:basic amino acid/polyamine antiporter, APA family